MTGSWAGGSAGSGWPRPGVPSPGPRPATRRGCPAARRWPGSPGRARGWQSGARRRRPGIWSMRWPAGALLVLGDPQGNSSVDTLIGVPTIWLGTAIPNRRRIDGPRSWLETYPSRPVVAEVSKPCVVPPPDTVIGERVQAAVPVLERRVRRHDDEDVTEPGDLPAYERDEPSERLDRPRAGVGEPSLEVTPEASRSSSWSWFCSNSLSMREVSPQSTTTNRAWSSALAVASCSASTSVASGTTLSGCSTSVWLSRTGPSPPRPWPRSARGGTARREGRRSPRRRWPPRSGEAARRAGPARRPPWPRRSTGPSARCRGSRARPAPAEARSGPVQVADRALRCLLARLAGHHRVGVSSTSGPTARRPADRAAEEARRAWPPSPEAAGADTMRPAAPSATSCWTDRPGRAGWRSGRRR